MTPAERVAIREAIAKLEEALVADEQAALSLEPVRLSTLHCRCGAPAVRRTMTDALCERCPP